MKMNIAFISTNFPSSGNTFITNQKTGLIDLGHDISIFANAPQSTLSRLHEDILQYELHRKVRYYGKNRGLTGALMRILKDFKQAPIPTVKRIAMSFDRDLFQRRGRLVLKGRWLLDQDITWRGKEYFHNAYLLLRTFESLDQIDIWNVHFGPVCNKMLFLKDIFPHSKFVANFHGYDFSSHVRALGADQYCELFEKADLVTTHSMYSRDCLISLGCPPKKILKHPLGVYAHKFVFRARKYTPSSNIKFIIVSRLVEKKGHRILLEAFARLLRKCRNVELHIVGDGPQKLQICQQINTDGILSNHVHMHGWLTQNEIIKTLDTCHVFVHPSVTTMSFADQEDTPTAIIEAQAMGLPVISTFHAGIPEVVEHGKTGLLVPERNVNALYEAMLQLVKNPEKWSEMGAAGRDLVEARFDIKNLNKKLEFVFNKLKNLPPGTALNLESSEQIVLEGMPNSNAQIARASVMHNACG